MTEDESLEDRAFGRAAATTGGTRAWSDGVVAYMPPLIATAILIVVLSWSLCKTIEYHEAIVANPRYRTGVLVFNGACAVAASLVVGYTVRAEALTAQK